MAKPLTLIGGRYDGFLFGDEGGWKPDRKVERLHLSRPDPLEWNTAKAEAASAIVTTTLVAVPYRVNDEPWKEPGRADAETYVRCEDGSFRIPSLVRCS